ncbi:hypothetical protein [Pseudoxanthomonas jiangsuensis]|uniref:hypothetical protein n=1 Tax=Pseudoxanthomonas jiangsuensis TaxID=619688 RepID=UPI0013918652|nr:hypothetical protein [Pseudoxanthomonas jiangsuensis]
MTKIIAFPAPPPPDFLTWEEALEMGIGLYIEGDPPPGVCPAALAAATALLTDIPTSAEIIMLSDHRK